MTKDGVRHKLKPLKETKEKAFSNVRIYLVDGWKFPEGIKYEHMCFSLIPKVDKEEVEDVHVEFADLLNELQDIVFDHTPHGLPPMRKISHQMYLILGTSFPNKATHKMTPTKSEELKMQVQELLQKGMNEKHIREGDEWKTTFNTKEGL